MDLDWETVMVKGWDLGMATDWVKVMDLGWVMATDWVKG
jgi:hypothetical protein